MIREWPSELRWIGKLRPKETAFEAIEEECKKLFIKEKEAVAILNKVMLPEQINQTKEKQSKKSKSKNKKRKRDDPLTSNDLGHVVFKFSADEYRFHFFFLLQLIQNVIVTFIERRKSDDDAQTANCLMETAFLEKLRSVWSVGDYKKKRMEYESNLKDIIGTNFELGNFECYGVKVFSEKHMKFTDITRMKAVVTALNTLKQRDGMIAHIVKLANVVCNTAYEVTCNLVEFLVKYVSKKNLQRLREERGKKKDVEGSYEDGKELADRQEIRFSDEDYTRLIAGGELNLAPTEKDIAELPDDLHKAKLKQRQPPQGRNKGMGNTAPSLTFESEKLALLNLGLIRLAMKKGAEDFPPKLKISDAEINNPTECVKKLEGIGKKVRNRGKAVEIAGSNSDIEAMSTLKAYVWKNTGIVACYRITSENDEKLIAIKWIDKNSFLAKVNDEYMMKPDVILEKFIELAGHCKGITLGSRIAYLGSSQELKQQVLHKIQKDLCYFRDEASAVHHIVKHGNQEKVLPIQTVTEERFTDAKKEYFEKVKTAAIDICDNCPIPPLVADDDEECFPPVEQVSITLREVDSVLMLSGCTGYIIKTDYCSTTANPSSALTVSSCKMVLLLPVCDMTLKAPKL